MQRWNLTSIFEEYRRYAGSKVRVLNEQFVELFSPSPVTISSSRKRYAGSKVRVLNEQFIELFDTDLVTISSSRKPAWL
ncbi:hypothetical protein T484DRAFT_1769354 [Baffinella frigidus]|nr:hypothetical protein T484DRAFT_1769354 [Cryptophyta sp. CCMP2293]